MYVILWVISGWLIQEKQERGRRTMTREREAREGRGLQGVWVNGLFVCFGLGYGYKWCVCVCAMF